MTSVMATPRCTSVPGTMIGKVWSAVTSAVCGKLKPLGSFPVYAGWIRAIRAGHTLVARGLDVRAPVLVECSARSGHPSSMSDPSVSSTDIVLDVEQIRRRAPLLGRHVTIAMIEGALHDVTLSAEPVRKEVFGELDAFLGAYVEGGSATG